MRRTRFVFNISRQLATKLGEPACRAARLRNTPFTRQAISDKFPGLVRTDRAMTRMDRLKERARARVTRTKFLMHVTAAAGSSGKRLNHPGTSRAEKGRAPQVHKSMQRMTLKHL
jgi:hypothetical protein